MPRAQRWFASDVRLQIIRCVSRDAAGYGRSGDEAQANAGLSDDELGSAATSTIEIADMPPANDLQSATAAESVCRFHVEEDDELPAAVRNELRELLNQRRFASAVQYCFEMVWDRGFELDLPSHERKYLP